MDYKAIGLDNGRIHPEEAEDAIHRSVWRRFFPLLSSRFASKADVASLSSTYATQSPTDIMAGGRETLDRVKRKRLGIIGTSGKPVISLRFDHDLDRFLTVVQPLLKARYLPFSFGVVTGSINNPGAGYEPTAKTWADVRTQVAYIGGELWAHSRTHGDGVSLESEIVGCRDDMLANNLQPAGFHQPGGPATYGPFQTVAELDSPAGKLIRATYPLYETYLPGAYRTLPTDGCRGLNHVTLDALTLAEAKAFIDVAVTTGMGLELMLHPKLVGTVGYMSVADFTAVLDYVKGLWNADTIEVMTGSGLAFADPSSTYRRSVVPHGSFEGLTTAAKPAPWAASLWWTIGTDGGRTGSNYLRLSTGQTYAQCSLDASIVTNLMAGGTFMLEAWYRTGHGGTGSARPTVRIMCGSALLGSHDLHPSEIFASSSSSPSWVRLRIPFSLPVDASSCNFLLSRVSADAGHVDWDDVRVIAI